MFYLTTHITFIKSTCLSWALVVAEATSKTEDKVGGGREQGSHYNIRTDGALPPGWVTEIMGSEM